MINASLRFIVILPFVFYCGIDPLEPPLEIIQLRSLENLLHAREHIDHLADDSHRITTSYVSPCGGAWQNPLFWKGHARHHVQAGMAE